MSNNNPFIPDFETFSREVKSTFIDGNLREAYTELGHHINNYKLDDEETPVTYGLIMEKWKACIKLWNYNFGNKKPEYLTREQREQKYNIHDFVVKFKYNDEFSMDKGDVKRDEYLFPPWMKTVELYDLFQQITSKINARRKKIIEE